MPALRRLPGRPAPAAPATVARPSGREGAAATVDDRTHRGDALVANHAHRAGALVVDGLIGMDGDNAPRVLPAGVRRAKLKGEQGGFVVARGTASSVPARRARRGPGRDPPGAP